MGIVHYIPDVTGGPNSHAILALLCEDHGKRMALLRWTSAWTWSSKWQMQSQIEQRFGSSVAMAPGFGVYQDARGFVLIIDDLIGGVQKRELSLALGSAHISLLRKCPCDGPLSAGTLQHIHVDHYNECARLKFVCSRAAAECCREWADWAKFV